MKPKTISSLKVSLVLSVVIVPLKFTTYTINYSLGLLFWFYEVDTYTCFKALLKLYQCVSPWRFHNHCPNCLLFPHYFFWPSQLLHCCQSLFLFLTILLSSCGKKYHICLSVLVFYSPVTIFLFISQKYSILSFLIEYAEASYIDF